MRKERKEKAWASIKLTHYQTGPSTLTTSIETVRFRLYVSYQEIPL